MALAISLVGTIVAVFLLRKPIKKNPTVFYAIAVIVDILFLKRLLFDISHAFAVAVYPYIFRCLIGFSLFVIVMFIGAFPDKSRVKQMLAPIRGELSVIACILTIGHVLNYLDSYFEQLISGFVGMSVSMVFSFFVSLVLVILLIPLTVTSFDMVKRNMDAKTWKNIQRSAYLFFGLTYVHIMFMLVPTISHTNQRALFSAVIYTAIFVVYAAMRLLKAWADYRGRLAPRQN